MESIFEIARRILGDSDASSGIKRMTWSLFARKISLETSPLVRRINWRLSGYRDGSESLKNEINEMP